MPRSDFGAGVDTAVEVLDRAANLALTDHLQQPGLGQLGDVVVDGAERRLQLEAEVLGGEGPATVEAEYLED